jgi:hypothetical protein
MENLLAGRDYRRRTPAPQPALLVDYQRLASVLRPIPQHTEAMDDDVSGHRLSPGGP